MFDLGQERESVRGGYGQNSFGQGCLLARRLVERDVRFVEVTLGGWDTHRDNFNRLQTKLPEMDQAMAAYKLASTLHGLRSRRGQVDSTFPFSLNSNSVAARQR